MCLANLISEIKFDIGDRTCEIPTIIAFFSGNINIERKSNSMTQHELWEHRNLRFVLCP